MWNSVYNWSVGPVAFAIFCEVSATRVRSKTIAVATAVQALAGIVMTVAIPYLINPDQANLGGKLGFFFGGLSVPCLLWWYLDTFQSCLHSPSNLPLSLSQSAFFHAHCRDQSSSTLTVATNLFGTCVYHHLHLSTSRPCSFFTHRPATP